jgi:ADP-ribose pyrophosphatase YjhB (NUDIX family)
MGKDKQRHCGYCGVAYASTSWPRVCGACGETTWRNPTPVAVLVVPVTGNAGEREGRAGGGVLVIRRNIPPAGRLALPGGFVDFGETWQAAAVREVREEAGLALDAAEVRHGRTVSAPDGSVVLVFGVHRPVEAASLGGWEPNSEVLERLVVREPVELAFPLHTDVLRAWFSGEL